MVSRDACVEKYKEFKLSKNGSIPEYREFLTHAGIDKRQLERLFGSSAYSKLQQLAGDTPNKLELKAVPFEAIMRQYGNLVMELGAIPPASEWRYRGLRPSEAGLAKKPHNMKWSELPGRFLEWIEQERITGFEKAVEIIKSSTSREPKRTSEDIEFSKLIAAVRAWTPARRRNTEESYKVELRKSLESTFQVNEEFGESNFDLLVNDRFAVEIKKDPSLSEYDRLFGQVARHLQHQCKVIVLTLEALRGDKYDNFIALVDKYLNVDKNSVEVIKK